MLLGVAALLALASALVYGAGDFMGGLASRRVPAAAVVLRSNLIGMVGLLLAAMMVAAPMVRGVDLGYGAVGGLAGAIGIFLLYRGLASGQMSVVAPLTAVLSAIVPAVIGVLGGDAFSMRAAAGIVAALVGIALLSRETNQSPPVEAGGRPGGEREMTAGVVLLACAAGLGFGLFFVCLGAAGDDAGLWPLVSARAVSVVMSLSAVALVPSNRIGSSVRSTPGLVRLLVGCGVADAAANGLFVLATHRGTFALVAVLGSLYPASTVALASRFAGERLAVYQRVGVAFTLVGVALISASS